MQVYMEEGIKAILSNEERRKKFWTRASYEFSAK